MKLSIHTTITDPHERQYPYIEALRSYLDLADEVIIVDGGSSDETKNVSLADILDTFSGDINKGKMKIINLPWPEDYTQKEFPIHLNAGLEACTGDWAMKLDIDHIIHDQSIQKIREQLEVGTSQMFLTIGKLTVIDRFHATLKSKLPIIINRIHDVGKDIRYGLDEAEIYNDWSWPVIPNGYYQGDRRIPIGTALEEDPLAYIREEFWNYDYFFRTKDISKRLFARAAKGYWKQTGKALWGATDEQSWQIFINQSEARKAKDMREIKVKDHPKYIQDRVKDLSPECFGFDHWGGNYL